MTKNNSLDTWYCNLIKLILNNGVNREDRTGTGTKSIFKATFQHDMSEGFPILTSKHVSFKNVYTELMWFLSGSTDIRDLIRHNCFIWNGDFMKKIGAETQTDLLRYVIANTYASSYDLGKIYGHQWRCYNDEVDQIEELFRNITENPTSRRLMVNAWNPADLDDCILPPCHYGFQCYVENGKLSLDFNMRSVDVLLGMPYNIASYGALLTIIAGMTGLEPGTLSASFVNVHIYNNQIEFVEKQLNNPTYLLPSAKFNPIKNGGYNDLLRMRMDDLCRHKLVTLKDYKNAGKVSYPLSN